MFESLFLAVNLASYYGKRLVLTYATVHLRKNTTLPAICNHELKTFEVYGMGRVGDPDSVISKLLSVYLNLSRRYNMTIPGKVARKMSGERLLRNRIGFWGHGEKKGLPKMLGLNEPVNWKHVLRNPIQINLTPEQEERGRKGLRELGIPDGKPFVCLYVRDNGFVKKHSIINIAKFYASDIHTYARAVKTVMDDGYHVIRMGDSTAVPIDIGGDFINYAHCPHQTDLMDLYLYRHCEFMMSTGGGARFASIFYNRPTIVTNWIAINMSGYCIGQQDMFIVKHIFSAEKKRLLSLREQLELIDVDTDRWCHFYPDRYIYVDNTEQEIDQVIKEWLEANRNPRFNWNHQLQEEYHHLKIKHARKKSKKYRKQTGKIYSTDKYLHFRPKIGNEFIENCWEYGPYLKSLTEQFLGRHKDTDIQYSSYYD
ncbi:MAG: TIGR04372 family glycosyltransferase [Nitrospinaceae bacterium]|nr:TIGR04372 family glycosyltransferase [Nitrospinaceae bacterium]